MRLYLDASVLVALFTNDDLSDRATALLSPGATPVVSDFAAAEFASAIARLVRIRSFRAVAARTAFAAFDQWTTKAVRAEVVPSDMSACSDLLRRLDLPLRTGDALNIAIARRLEATLATMDLQMAQSARALGLTVHD